VAMPLLMILLFLSMFSWIVVHEMFCVGMWGGWMTKTSGIWSEIKLRKAMLIFSAYRN
jgi:hypothetical protein